MMMTDAAGAERAFLAFEAALAHTVGPVRGLRVLDIGCGGGAATRRLAAQGAVATGIDPNADAVAAAQAAGGGPDYAVAPAEATGFPDEAFDGAVFSNSLHHAEDPLAGLREAARVVRPSGWIAALEPEAPDPMHPVSRWIDDEAEAYAAAQAAIAAAVADGVFSRGAALRFAAKHRVETPDAFLADMIGVDGGRALADADRPAFEAAFAVAHRRDDQGGFLPYWQRLDVLTRI